MYFARGKIGSGFLVGVQGEKGTHTGKKQAVKHS